MNATNSPLDTFKAAQREMWSGFAANEGFTSMTAAQLVEFAQLRQGERVLDVGCGTGVVAVTAALAGASAAGLDLTPALLERARENAWIAGVEVEFTEGDVENLPYPDSVFDVVLSQFGHMFAPRPEIATAEMLRVLKPGGRIAFSTWPPEHVMGQLFTALSRYKPAHDQANFQPAPPPRWGDPNVVRERLGDAVSNVRFSRATMRIPALSPRHVLLSVEATFGPLKNLLKGLDAAAPFQAEALRAEIVQLAAENIQRNILHQHYLMTQAVKK